MTRDELVAWVASVFDHPGDGPAWYHDPDFYAPEPPAAERVARFTALLAEPARLLAPYSDAQLARGLWYLVDNACSTYGLAVLDRSVEVAVRARCVAAIPRLFAEVFQARCARALSHGDTQGDHPLNTTCYMWWDVFPSWGSGDPIDAHLLGAMEAILALEAPACRESALHGLGHWQARHPDRVRGVIDAFLERGDLPEELERYARAARGGCVQ